MKEYNDNMKILSDAVRILSGSFKPYHQHANWLQAYAKIEHELSDHDNPLKVRLSEKKELKNLVRRKVTLLSSLKIYNKTIKKRIKKLEKLNDMIHEVSEKVCQDPEVGIRVVQRMTSPPTSTPRSKVKVPEVVEVSRPDAPTVAVVMEGKVQADY